MSDSQLTLGEVIGEVLGALKKADARSGKADEALQRKIDELVARLEGMEAGTAIPFEADISGKRENGQTYVIAAGQQYVIDEEGRIR